MLISGRGTVASDLATKTADADHAVGDEPGAPEFDADIRPILSNTCFHCHGPDEANRSADLRLDTEEGAKEYAIVGGDLEASELISRINSDDPDLMMPPPDQKQQLSQADVEALERWVSAGADWSQHWAYVAPVRAAAPRVNTADWPNSDIDAFVLAQIEDAGRRPSLPASRETLIRRLSLDLTGVPPTLDEIDAFLADRSPRAVERVVDRLLASPRYGEHMAQAWLAAARYADTNGYQNDGTRTMWPWRDWVVRAMNDNMPFDQFTVEQLAGDLLDNPTTEQLIATGFHRNHGLNGEGGRNPEESRVEYVIDRASTTGTVWMGLTVGCSRCHDHKYDAISQQEFYELTAYFNSIDERGGVDAGGNAKPVLALPTEGQRQQIAEHREAIARVEQRFGDLPPAPPEDADAWLDETRAWLRLARAGGLWSPLRGVELECKHGVEWEQLEDGSVLVSSMPQSGDDYEVSMPLPPGRHHGLRLEALKDPALTGGWYSSGLKGGFSVTGLEVELDGETVALADAEANVGGKAGASGLLDTKKFTKWSVTDPKNAPLVPTWVARFTDPIEAEVPRRLLVRMRHRSRMGEAPIGRFRLAVTAFPTPTVRPDLGLERPVAVSLAKSEGDRSAEDGRLLHEAFRSFRRRPFDQQIESIREQIKQVESNQLKTMVMRDREKPRETYRLERGLWNQPDKRQKLRPGVLACLPPLEPDAPPNRLALARWLVREDHPLTARVTVNRYWQHFFGIGLVKTTEDFGVQGERPSHPKLLDWLAREFVESGWDVKHLHKRIVLSATYQQASHAEAELFAADPYNRLLARGPRFRLSAQALRDQALAISGLLVEKQGGPGVLPYQPNGVWNDFSLGKINYRRGQGDELYRRSLYTFWRRPVGPTLFFDNQGRQMCVVRPNLTNTPLHALTMLNDVTYVEAARVMAEAILAAVVESESERVRLAFRRATARVPTAQELDRLLQTLRELESHYRDNPGDAAELLQVGESQAAKDLDPAEAAAYTSLMNVILNLDEVVTKG